MKFKTYPAFDHQHDEWKLHRATEIRGLLWEQGVGKSRTVLDQSAWLYLQDRLIDGLLILAPNGVHENWITDEIPVHLIEDVPWDGDSYYTSKSKTKRHKARMQEIINYEGLAILAMSYDAFMTKQGKATVDEFLAKRKTFYVCDESQRIKTPGAKRTRSVVYSGRRATYKRILTGTPVTNSPFDIYSQIKFLDEHFWKKNGFASYEAFKTHFGIWEARINNKTGGRFNQVVAFKNLDQLSEIVATICSRVTKEEALDLPPKIYTKRYFNLSAEQRRIYKGLKEDFMVFLDNGDMITAPLVITQMLRLQQVTCGYVPSDDCEKLHHLPENPRLKLLLDTLSDVEGQAIIFARFRQDIDQICRELGEHAVRYDGAVKGPARAEARKRFQAGDVRFFVGNPAAAGTGLTLHAAKTVIYYSNSFNLEHRLQSEDRAHRIGQNHSVRYIDLVAQGTLDSYIVSALRRKLNIASQITGDKIREWL